MYLIFQLNETSKAKCWHRKKYRIFFIGVLRDSRLSVEKNNLQE